MTAASCLSDANLSSYLSLSLYGSSATLRLATGFDRRLIKGTARVYNAEIGGPNGTFASIVRMKQAQCFSRVDGFALSPPSSSSVLRSYLSGNTIRFVTLGEWTCMNEGCVLSSHGH